MTSLVQAFHATCVHHGGPISIYRFTCPCSGAVEDHELVMLGYKGLSNPPRWVDTGSHYVCERCGRKRAYVAPPPPAPPPPLVITLQDDDESLGGEFM